MTDQPIGRQRTQGGAENGSAEREPGLKIGQARRSLRYRRVGDIPAELQNSHLDLGSVLVPVVEGGQVTVEMTADHQPEAVYLEHRSGASVWPRSPPKTPGTWREVVRELAESPARQRCDHLHRRRPLGPGSGRRGAGYSAPVHRGRRPRWLIRCVALGPTEATEPLSQLARGARGIGCATRERPYPPREPLPIELPRCSPRRWPRRSRNEPKPANQDSSISPGMKPMSVRLMSRAPPGQCRRARRRCARSAGAGDSGDPDDEDFDDDPATYDDPEDEDDEDAASGPPPSAGRRCNGCGAGAAHADSAAPIRPQRSPGTGRRGPQEGGSMPHRVSGSSATAARAPPPAIRATPARVDRVVEGCGDRQRRSQTGDLVHPRTYECRRLPKLCLEPVAERAPRAGQFVGEPRRRRRAHRGDRRGQTGVPDRVGGGGGRRPGRRVLVVTAPRWQCGQDARALSWSPVERRCASAHRTARAAPIDTPPARTDRCVRAASSRTARCPAMRSSAGSEAISSTPSSAAAGPNARVT